MSKKIIFGIDCDEVLRATLDAMVSLYNREFNTNKKRDDVNDFVVENSFPLINELTGTTAGEWFFQIHSKELFLESNALPDIAEAINKLKKYGDVIICTYQKTYKNKIDTLQWLENNNIIPDGICFLKDKTILHCDYFIDDNDWNFIGSNAIHGILINAPYNYNKDINTLLNQSNCNDINRYNSLKEFADDFDNKNSFILSNNQIVNSEYYI